MSDIDKELENVNEIVRRLYKKNNKVTYSSVAKEMHNTKQAIFHNAKSIVRDVKKIKQLHSIKRCKDAAKKLGGKLISTEFNACDKKLEWKCNNPNHPTFLKTFNQVYHLSSWCPLCRIENKQRKVTETLTRKAKAYARKKGGVLITNEVNNIYEILEWGCHKAGHPTFKSSYNNLVNKNRWCRKCLAEKKKK